MVGTDIGNTYKDRQGTGFATIAPYDPQVDLSLLEMRQRKEQLAAQEKAAKEKKLMDAYGQMAKIKPDNWYVHDKQVSGLVNGAIDLGASILQRGEDPFNGQSDEAINFNKLLTETTKYTEYSKQFQKDFAQAQQAYKNGEEVENWDDIVTWFHNPDLIGMANGDYGQAPKPVFKKPEVDTQKVIFDSTRAWQLSNAGLIPSLKNSIDIAEGMIANPAFSNGFGSTDSKMRQRYNDVVAALPEDERGKFDAEAARVGSSSGYAYWIAKQVHSVNNPDESNSKNIEALAVKIGTHKYSKETDSVTKSGSYIKSSDKELRARINGELQDGGIERDVAAKIYGNPDWTADKNRKAAIDYFLPILKNMVDTESGRTEDEAGKEGKKTEASFTNWYNDITSGDGEKFIAAAPYLDKEALARFVPDMKSTSKIGNVKYYRSGRIDIIPVDLNGIKDGTYTLNIKDIPKEMLKNAYMNQYRGTKRNYETTETGATADDIGVTGKTTTADDL